jgi:glutaredoxin
MKKSKFVIIGLIIVVLAVLGVFEAKKMKAKLAQNKAVAGVSTQAAQNTNDQMILFVGSGCPHCAKVEDFINQNQVNSKLSFQTKEVFYDKNNQATFEEKAKECNLDLNNAGVPMLWTGGSNCIEGDQPIIDYFNQQINK